MTDSSSHSHPTSEAAPDSRSRRRDRSGTNEPAAEPDAARVDRRQFIRRTAGCLSVLAASGTVASVSGCTLPVRSFQTSGERRIVIPLSRFPELRRPGGIIKVRHPVALAVYVRCVGEGVYDAISGVCTHQGCIVDPVRDEFHCPCHGSTYDRRGANQAGPARAPLERFAASRSGDNVILDLPENRT